MRVLTSALVLLLAAAGCRAAEASDDAAVVSCLERAGIDDDLGDVDLRRQQDADFDADLVRCYGKVGVELPAPGELTAAWDALLLQEVQCLRDKGWDVPDPVRHVEGAALNMGNVGDYVPEDQFAAFDRDDAACVEQIAPPGETFKIEDLQKELERLDR